MVKINYLVEGKGEAVVLIHGLSDNLLYWEILASALKSDFKVIRYDLRGHGQSELGEDKITVGLFSDDLKNLLDVLNVEKASLIGFSLGGMVAIDFAVKYPSMVSSLVLMSTASKLNSHSKGVLDSFSKAIDEGFETFYDFVLPLVLCPDVIEKNKEELETLKEIAAPLANNSAIKKAIGAAFQFDLDGDLSKIDVPVLVLAGKHDGIFLPSQQKEMREKIENSEFVVFDDVRHNLLVGENVSKMVDELKKFL